MTLNVTSEHAGGGAGTGFASTEEAHVDAVRKAAAKKTVRLALCMTRSFAKIEQPLADLEDGQ